MSLDSTAIKVPLPPEPPAELITLLSSLDSDKTTDEGKVSQAIVAYKKDRQFREKENKAIWAELDGFNFRLLAGYENSIWGTRFAPTFVQKSQGGKEIYTPDIKNIDIPTIDYWKKRSLETNNPVMKARYCDLVWDLGASVLGSKKGLQEYARLAIVSYRQAVREKRYDQEIIAIWYLQRALEIAILLSDSEAIEAIKAEMFLLHDGLKDSTGIHNQTFLFDLLYENPKTKLTEEERDGIILRLERMLADCSNTKDGEKFDPFGAQSASERLARHYRKFGEKAAVARVIKAQGDAFVTLAKQAAPSLALNWLRDTEKSYRDIGLNSEADSVQVEAQKKSQEVEENLLEQSFTVKFSKDKIDYLHQLFTTGDLKTILFRLIHQFAPTLENAKQINETIEKNNPLLSRIAIVKDDGHETSRVGSYEEDPQGREIYALARSIDFSAPLLALAIDDLRETHTPTSQTIMDFLSESPIFDKKQNYLLEEGLAAYLEGDNIKAVHVLIPQIEVTLRNLLIQGQKPTSKPRHGMAGFMQAISLGDILSEEWAISVLGPDLTKYLQVFLNDPRGFNLRNRFAHGLMGYDEMNRQRSDRLLHILLTLSLLGRKLSNDKEDS